MKKPADWSQIVKESAVLAPVDRISEVLFGLIMVLTFTGAISVGTDAKEDIRELLWAALGCNLAWGLVDAIMFLMSLILERGHAIHAIQKIKSEKDQSLAREILKGEIPPFFNNLMDPSAIDALTNRIKQSQTPSSNLLLTWADIMAAIQIFLLVFLCTLPIALPFGIMTDAGIALRISNGIALLMLFVGGYFLAGYAGFRKFLTAISYMAIGVLLVALTMALGG